MTVPPSRRRSPRGPLVLDIRELSRRAGSMKHVVTRVPAPAGLGTEMINVPPGALIELDLRLEAVMEGVLVSGTASTPLAGECSRCLDPFEDEATVDIRELFYYPDRVVDNADDDDCQQVVNDHLDLVPALRDALVLSLPLSPCCRPDCAGLCVDCGARLDDLEPDHTHERVDPRWAALPSLVENPSQVENPAAIDNKEKD
ncbi:MULTISPECIES: YceD family protein [unclassified Frankia]|uniref:YceD family protein n=1 Tax=unclassified Frankia TaxID=2632575 RepID=UPI002AD390D3|nr:MULTISPECIES: YceD family protein [unclassified Frankia]